MTHHLDDLNNEPREDHLREVDEARLNWDIRAWEGRGASNEEALQIVRTLESHPEYFDMFVRRNSEYG